MIGLLFVGLFLVVGGAVWWGVAHWLEQKGQGFIVRQVGGIVLGFLAAFFGVVGIARLTRPFVAPQEERVTGRPAADTTYSSERVPLVASPAMPLAPPPLVDDVTLAIEPPAEEGPHRVTVTTNLPDGTSLMFTVTAKTAPGESYQDKVDVKGGRAQAGPFGKGGMLPSGTYEIDVTMPIPEAQSPETRRVIGEQGENLRGPLVVKGNLGVTVEKTHVFTLGGAATSTAAQAVREATKLLGEVVELERAARAMVPLRKTHDNAKLRECGTLMRKHQTEAERLRDEASKLPIGLGLHIGVAAGHLVLCASCMDTADEQCDLARQSLKEAKQAIAAAR